MKTRLIFSACIVLCLFANIHSGLAQKGKDIHVKMEPGSWEFETGKVSFEDVGGRQAIVFKDRNHKAILKGVDFSDGTIEFDLQPAEMGFTSIYFRRQGDAEGEHFYFRTGYNRNKDSEDAIQYAPLMKGVNLWDMFPEYQSNVSLEANTWHHVKAIIHGKQMKIYVDDLQHPVLVVPHIEGNVTHGAISIEGLAKFANMHIKPGNTEDVPAQPGFDITDNDPRYLRRWEASRQVRYIDPKIGMDYNTAPDSTTQWIPMQTERKGMLNLSREFGGDNKRSIIWIRTQVNADKDIEKTLRLGFSDEVWVFVNKQLVYLDKNLYGRPMMKAPSGRISLENASIQIPLKEGKNEILMAVENDFYGWGIIARFDSNENIWME